MQVRTESPSFENRSSPSRVTGFRLALMLATLTSASTTTLAASDNHLYTLASDGSQGSYVTALVKGSDGAFYGTTRTMTINSPAMESGGAIFRMTADGRYTLLHGLDSFSNSDETNKEGISPSGLTAGSDGAFYGFAELGGSTGNGTLFRVSTDGTYTVLHTFAAYDNCGCKTNTGGANPAALSFGSDGALYGVTQTGGPSGYGTFFRLALDGSYTDLHDFPDLQPYDLVAGADGNFYGHGVGNGLGPVSGNLIFRLKPDGTYSLVHQLGSTSTGEGEWINAMIYGRDGNLYVGTGDNQGGVGTNGALLRVGLDGSTSILHSFAPNISHLVWQGIYGGWVRTPLQISDEGASPVSLIQAADGTLYGALEFEGPDSGGSVFSMAPDGSNFNVLHSYGTNTPEASAQPHLVADAADGSVMVATGNNELFNLLPAAPLTVTASFSPSTVALFQNSKLTWSSTGAASCKISGDYVKTLRTVTATSGSRTVWTYSTQSRLPAQFFAAVNCVSADGKSVGNTTAMLTVQ